MSETTPEKSEETQSSTQSAETEALEQKIEETEEKLDEAKANPEYATKEDIANLTTLLNEFREELKEAKAKKPVIPAPEKKEEPKQEAKEESKKEEPKKEETFSYGSRRWFGGR